MAKPTFSERFCFPISEGEPSVMTFSASNHRLMGHKMNISRPNSETIGRLLESFFFRTPVPPANTLEYRRRRVIQQERVEEFAKCNWPQIQLNVHKLNTRMLFVNVLQAVLIFSLRGSPSRPQRSRQGTRPPFIIPPQVHHERPPHPHTEGKAEHHQNDDRKQLDPKAKADTEADTKVATWPSRPSLKIKEKFIAVCYSKSMFFN
jgi:hypothetical protein